MTKLFVKLVKVESEKRFLERKIISFKKRIKILNKEIRTLVK